MITPFKIQYIKFYYLTIHTIDNDVESEFITINREIKRRKNDEDDANKNEKLQNKKL